MFENQYIDYAADMTILLAYYKCKDDWKDEANQIVIQAQKKLKEEGKQMDKAVKKQLKSANEALQKCLSRLRVDKVTQEDINKLKCAKEEVEMIENKMFH